MRRGAALLLLLSLGACQAPTLVAADGTVEISEEQLEFGEVYPSRERALTVEVKNHGRSDLPLVFGPLAAPFRLREAPSLVPSGVLHLTVVFAPTEAGPVESVLTLRSDNGSEDRVRLSGVGKPIPVCTEPPVCKAVAFNLDLEACVDLPLADGAGCDPQNICVVGPACRDGRCVGAARSCDDQNPCTADVCHPVQGCQHLPVVCPGAGACKVGVCNPASGCELSDAQDGTVCGPVACHQAQICILGDCVTRDPPEGFTCAPASPCQAAGVCVNDVCERPPAVTLQPAWGYSSGALPTPPRHHDLLMEPSGDVTVGGWFAQPWPRANLGGAQLPSARRCIHFGGRLLCADYRDVARDGRLALVDPATGVPSWVFELGAARPDYLNLVQPGRLFMARAISLGADRLAAIYEGYPQSPTGAQCRIYFLAVLDAGGRLISSSRMQDPALEECNHPHPFGAASDAEGNFYLAFSPSEPTGAPLVAASPTLLWGFDRDGATRWKKTANFRGGELSVGRGVLLSERASTGFRTLDGMTIPGGTLPIGRSVLSSNRVVSVDEAAAPSLVGRALPNLAVSWHWSARPLVSPEVRLAKLGDGTAAPLVALTFTGGGPDGGTLLTGVAAESGEELFACPLALPEGTVNLFELAGGRLAVMGGASTCGACDPPFAESSASFALFDVPGLFEAQVPWEGTFGGPGHDHHEEQLLVGPGQ